MNSNRKYTFMLKYSEDETDKLTESVYAIVTAIMEKKLDDSDKLHFFEVMKKIIKRGDFRSYSCINFLRDIMTNDLYFFLLKTLKKQIFLNEPLVLEIMKIITCDDFPEYNNFLKSLKDYKDFSPNFRLFINRILDFNEGKIKNLSFPIMNRKSRESRDIEIDWTYCFD